MVHQSTLTQKILFIDRRFGATGGAQHYLDHLVLECIRNGYEAELAVNTHSNLAANYQLISNQDAIVHHTPFGEQDAGVSAKWLSELIAIRKPDLIHVNSSCRELRQILVGVKNWNKIPCKRVFTMHLSVLSEKEYVGKRHWPWSYGAKTRQERKQFLAIFDRCISVSNENCVKVSTYFKLPQEQITYIPNGVDVSKFVPKKRTVSDQIVVGCCARLSTQKRLDVLIRAVAKLANRNNIVLKLAGDGSQREQLEVLANELGISDRVEFLGSQNDVCSFLHLLIFLHLPPIVKDFLMRYLKRWRQNYQRLSPM